MAAYPEGAVGDADSGPADGHGVLQRGGGRVAALVQAFPFAPHLHLHRKPLCILKHTDGNETGRLITQYRFNASLSSPLLINPAVHPRPMNHIC